MGQAYRQTTQRQQMQCVDEGQGVNMEELAKPGLRTMVCRWGTGVASLLIRGSMS